jgi:hypothetical protein
MTTDKKTLFNRKLIQYGLTGAALGVYYGIFYKPTTDADVGMAVLLSIFAALVTVLIRSFRKGFPFKKIAKDFLIIFGFFLIFMLSLTLRKLAFDLGGKVLVVVETTISGIIMGLLMAWQRFSSAVNE